MTVADDGGSSGRLRRELRMLPPGDFRQCIAALADVEPLMGALLQYRFREGSGLEGHNLGNLLIAAMADLTGSFERGLQEMSHILAVQGQILPSTLEDVALAAELRDKSTVHGESNMHEDHASGDVSVDGRAPIDRVFLVPGNRGRVVPKRCRRSWTPISSSSVQAACTRASCPIYWSRTSRGPWRPRRHSRCSCVTWRPSRGRPTTTARRTSWPPCAGTSTAISSTPSITNTRLDADHPPYWRSDVVAARMA